MRARTRKSLLEPTPAAPTAEEIALRPELLRELFRTVRDIVTEHDLEHAVVIGITTTGAPRIYHSYGRDLPMKEVAKLLTDLAALARKTDGP